MIHSSTLLGYGMEDQGEGGGDVGDNRALVCWEAWSGGSGRGRSLVDVPVEAWPQLWPAAFW